MHSSRRKGIRLKAALFVVAVVIFSISFSGTIIYKYLVAQKTADTALLPVLALNDTSNKAPQYLGQTSTLYSGNLGGILGANAKCTTQFGAGAHICATRELIRSGATAFGAGGLGWIACEMEFDNASVPYTTCDTTTGTNTLNPGTANMSCNQWTDGTISYYGPVVGGTGLLYAATCNNSYAINCCRG